ncbi:MAG: Lysine--tRNA ligase [Candidatus Saccharibacteria bacterium]|nr:Lysine--tRNA ligase [Candidatus Saccharibacteria bacterium]
MNWLIKIVDEIELKHPSGEIVVSSGVSPSGTYHLGTLREVLTAEAIMLELKRRGRASRHLHIVDDLDVFRKVPADVPENFKQYLGKPLSDVPSPDGSSTSYADYFLADLIEAAKELNLQMEIVRAHEKYRSGFFVPAIEKALSNIAAIKQILEEVSGRKLEEQWTPIQVIEEGYLKNRPFISIDANKKTITYQGNETQHTVSYAHGDVKLSWRIDWPARWWLLGVDVEPFGRDHATKGGSYDTGVQIVEKVFQATAPTPVPYNFINRTGDTKKMSKSAGNTMTAADLLTILPPEIVWFFLLRYGPEKLLFFDTGDTLIRLFDEFAELQAKTDKTDAQSQLLEFCLANVKESTVSTVPFSHLVNSYQASLRDGPRTMEVIRRTEHADIVDKEEDKIKAELVYIDWWLDKWAPEDVKFSLTKSVDASQFTDKEKQFLKALSEKVVAAPDNADGEWFHKAIYDLKDQLDLQPKEMFAILYRTLIGKESGPRAGWFLSILPGDWLVKRLQLEA